MFHTVDYSWSWAKPTGTIAPWSIEQVAWFNVVISFHLYPPAFQDNKLVCFFTVLGNRFSIYRRRILYHPQAEGVCCLQGVRHLSYLIAFWNQFTGNCILLWELLANRAKQSLISMITQALINSYALISTSKSHTMIGMLFRYVSLWQIFREANIITGPGQYVMSCLIKDFDNLCKYQLIKTSCHPLEEALYFN